MSHSSLILVSIILCAGVFTVCASECNSPKVTLTSFSTQDATILTQVAHVGEFSVKCSNKARPNLFVQFPCGKVVPAARTGDDKYQVSWTEDVKKSSSGNVAVRVFDEEGHVKLRKAQRDNEQVHNVKSLFDLAIITKGAYTGPWVKAELVAAILVSAIAYMAVTTKSKVQS